MSESPVVWESRDFVLKVNEAEIPWLILYHKSQYREMSQLPEGTRLEIYTILDCIEREMLDYYKADKINIASFGNYLPRVHWHIMARFVDDSYFPEPLWGKRQREASLNLPDIGVFLERVKARIETLSLQSESLS